MSATEGPPAAPRGHTIAALVVVVLAALWMRFPAFLNAGAVNSDAAVVGLQALALLRGEWEAHLWGTNYQTIVDPLLAAGLFKVFGPSPWALFAVPWLGAALVVALVFLMLRRCMTPLPAALATLTIAFGSQAITSPMTYVLRQTMMLVVVLGLWLLHRAAASRLAVVACLFGAALLGLGIFVDVFALIMWPACALFALACCLDGGFSWKRSVATIVGLGVGLIPAKLVGHVGGGATPGLQWANFDRNWPLFKEQCFPFAISTKVWMPEQALYPDPWTPPTPVPQLMLAAAVLLGLLWLSGLLLLPVRRIRWDARRLGALGVAVGSATVIGFLFSGAPADIWSVRYLAPLVWTLPFALAPIASVLRPRGFGTLLAPFLVSAAVCCWLSWGKFVNGPLPVLHPRGSASAEQTLITELESRGVTAGAAQYWLAYRFSLLSAEKLPVVPLDGGDRYAPYRAHFDRSPKIALIFHPSEPRAQPGMSEAMLKASHARYETLRVEDFTAFIVDRTPPAPVPAPAP